MERMGGKIRQWSETIVKLAAKRAQALYGPVRERLRPYLEPRMAQLRMRYQRLEPREKYLVQIASTLAGLFLLYNLVYIPVQSLRADLAGRIDARQHQLLHVRRLVHDYQQRKLQLAAAQKRIVPAGKDFSLFSVLQETLTDTVGAAKVASITPQTDEKIAKDLTKYSVDASLEDVSLAQIVDALYGVKSLSVPVVVSNLHIAKRTQDPHSYDVQMTFVALGKNG